ncbi:MAG: leucine--tRNA ligase [Candidatus Westeberhardia cardiocondylae]|nr:leucine--tRNA ligase [Candidatus Westeberhardia cardiocondylae]
MKKFYNPKEVESLVQKYWYKNKIFKVQENCTKEKYYCLSMMPYPSGKLHMGHVRNYTIGDVISRYQRMLGKNVLHPIGWDSFGLPAERAAMIHDIEPQDWIRDNIRYMKYQLKMLGFSYDWDREINTCSPKYYKWEQWFFIFLYRKGLVYKKKSIVNWCPKDKTVLANEQVIKEKCWRCNTNIEKKNISQWFMRITTYADKLLNDLKILKYWPKKVIIMQRNWIGRIQGYEVIFSIFNYKEKLTVYMHDPLFLIYTTFIKISLDHSLIFGSTAISLKLRKFIKNFYNFDISEVNFNDNCVFVKKYGAIFTGIYAMHPLSKQKLPICIVEFSLLYFSKNSWIGTPNNDANDLKIVKRYSFFFSLNCNFIKDIRKNIERIFYKTGFVYDLQRFFLLSRSKQSDIVFCMLNTLKIGKKKIFYRLRDWCISRQRYWGVPIPIVILQDGSYKTIDEKDLPVVLSKYIPSYCTNSLSKNYIKRMQFIYNNENVTRETDTFDTFMESAWYFYRYTCPYYDHGMLNSTAVNYWLPIDQYIGGIEHATMHLLYCRLYHKILKDAGLLYSREPIVRLLCQGMVLSDTFYYISSKGEKIWVSPLDVKKFFRDKKGNIIKAIDYKGNNLIYDGMKKMSKSKNNGVDPENMIKKYGADTMRLFVMYAAPAHMPLEWKESGIMGMHRFLQRIWSIIYNYVKLHGTCFVKKICHYASLSPENKILYHTMHETIQKVTNDIDRRQVFNNAISSIIKLINKIKNFSQENSQDKILMGNVLVVVIKMLYPFAPHICFVLWKMLGNHDNIDYVSWPTVNKMVLLEKNYLVLIQVNGKFRAKIFLPKDIDESMVREIIRKKKLISKYVQNKMIKKIFFIPNKLINFVLK